MAESTRQREAFNRYWALGATRSVERLHAALVCEGTAPTLRTLYTWSSRYGWVDRVSDLERQARAADDEAHVQAIRDMAERHAQEALLLQQRSTEWLVGASPDAFDAPSATRALIEGIKLERLIRGEPTARSANTTEPDHKLEALSDAELDALITQLATRLG